MPIFQQTEQGGWYVNIVFDTDIILQHLNILQHHPRWHGMA